MTIIRYLVFLVILPSLAMQHKFHEKHESDIVASAKSAQELVSPVLTQLRLLCFAGERISFDHTELFIFDDSGKPIDAAYAIEPLPFKDLFLFDSVVHDTKKRWFAHVVAWLMRGIAIQNGEFPGQAAAYVAYTAYCIARALEDLVGTKLQDRVGDGLDDIKQQLFGNVQAFGQLFSVIQPLPCIQVRNMLPVVELARRRSWGAQMYKIVLQLYLTVNQDIDEQKPSLVASVCARMSEAAYRRWYDSYFCVYPLSLGESAGQWLVKELGIYQDVQITGLTHKHLQRSDLDN